jgi:hypothetical protein
MLLSEPFILASKRPLTEISLKRMVFSVKSFSIDPFAGNVSDEGLYAMAVNFRDLQPVRLDMVIANPRIRNMDRALFNPIA